jgi:hypothetical protein
VLLLWTVSYLYPKRFPKQPATGVLNQVPGVEIPESGIERRPSLSLESLAQAGAVEQFLSVYDWVVGEIQDS